MRDHPKGIAMTIELKVRFEGSTPGLSEHRLSLSEFQDALANLLQAVRRTATNLEQEATEVVPTYTGRYTKSASRLDLQILGVNAGSAEVCFALESTPLPNDNYGLFEWDYLTNTMERFLDHVENESRGRRSSASVRKFLSSLPEGVSKQAYELTKDNQALKSLVIGDVNLVEDSAFEGSRLLSAQGIVAGVYFAEDGQGVSIDLKGDGNHIKSVKCSPEYAEKALSFRGREVFAQIVKNSKGSRLVTLWLADSPPEEHSTSRRLNRIMSDWDETLKGLAK